MRFLTCDSEVVTLVTLWVIIRRGKGQGTTVLNMHPSFLPPLSFDAKRNVHIGIVQNVASGSENSMKGLKQQQVPVGQDREVLGCAPGSAFLGKSLVASTLNGDGSGGKEANFFIQSPSEHCRRLGREDRIQEGMSAC